jgi:hypothetical protein
MTVTSSTASDEWIVFCLPGGSIRAIKRALACQSGLIKNILQRGTGVVDSCIPTELLDVAPRGYIRSWLNCKPLSQHTLNKLPPEDLLMYLKVCLCFTRRKPKPCCEGCHKVRDWHWLFCCSESIHAVVTPYVFSLAVQIDRPTVRGTSLMLMPAHPGIHPYSRC